MANILWQSNKHLEAGDAVPADMKPDLLTLYAMQYCPFAQRTRLVLQHKQIEFQLVYVNTFRKPDWFLSKSPAGKVPVLCEPDGWLLMESLITSDYLDEAHPQAPLYPKDARQRARIRHSIAKMADSVIPAYYRWSMCEPGDRQKAEWESVLNALAMLQDDLGDSQYFGGSDQVQMADFMNWPFFERLPSACKLLGFELPEGRFDRLLAWMERMGLERAVKELRTPDDTHAAFLQSYRDKNPIFDGL